MMDHILQLLELQMAHGMAQHMSDMHDEDFQKGTIKLNEYCKTDVFLSETFSQMWFLHAN